MQNDDNTNTTNPMQPAGGVAADDQGMTAPTTTPTASVTEPMATMGTTEPTTVATEPMATTNEEPMVAGTQPTMSTTQEPVSQEETVNPMAGMSGQQPTSVNEQ